MTALFRNKSSANVFWLVAVSLALHSNFFITPPEVVVPHSNKLLEPILQWIQTWTSFGKIFLYHALIILPALRLNYMLNELKLFSKPAFTTALSYVLITALIPEWNTISVPLAMNIFTIWLLAKMEKLYRVAKPYALIYNTGLIAGLGTMLYASFVPVWLWCFFAVSTTRAFSLREWLMLLLGIVTPFYFLAGILYLINQLPDFLQYVPSFQQHIPAGFSSQSTLIGLSAIGILFLAGFYFYLLQAPKMTVQVRKTWNTILLLLFLLLPVSFIFQEETIQDLLLCAVPLSAFGGNAFLYPRKNLLPNLIFWLLVAAVLYNIWQPLFL